MKTVRMKGGDLHKRQKIRIPETNENGFLMVVVVAQLVER